MSNFKTIRPDDKDPLKELIIKSMDYLKMINDTLPINEDDQKIVDDIASSYLSLLKTESFNSKQNPKSIIQKTWK